MNLSTNKNYRKSGIASNCKNHDNKNNNSNNDCNNNDIFCNDDNKIYSNN